MIYIINILSLFIWKLVYDKSQADKTKTKRIIIFIITLQFVILQGFRSFTVGSDTLKYVSYYQLICDGNFSFLDLMISPPLNFEVGWLWLMKFCSLFNFSPRIFLLTVAIIINVLISVFIYRESDDFIMSYWIFIGIEFFTLSFTMLRQMIAISLILVSYSYLKKSGYKSISFAILAFFFHKTSIIYIIALIAFKIINKIRDFLNIKIISLIILITYSVLIIFGKKLLLFVTSFFYSYYKLENSKLGTLWFVMISILLILLLLYYYKERNDLFIENKLYYFIFLIFCASLLQYSSIFMSLLSRIALYFYVFAIIVLPYVSKEISNVKIKKYYDWSVYFLVFIQYIFFSMNMYNLIPYSIF